MTVDDADDTDHVGKYPVVHGVRKPLQEDASKVTPDKGVPFGRLGDP